MLLKKRILLHENRVIKVDFYERDDRDRNEFGTDGVSDLSSKMDHKYKHI